MGKYDNIPPERIRESLLRFALLVVRLERESVLLDAIPELQSLMGDLRRMLFAYEVRRAPEVEDADRTEEPEDEPDGADSLRIVQEALEREREFLRELEDTGTPGRDDDETDD